MTLFDFILYNDSGHYLLRAVSDAGEDFLARYEDWPGPLPMPIDGREMLRLIRSIERTPLRVDYREVPRWTA